MRGRRLVTALTAVLLVIGVAGDAPWLPTAPVEWRAAWSMPLEAGDSPLGAPLTSVSEQDLAVAAGGAVRVHDPRTGALRRTLPAEPGFPASVTGVWVVPPLLVVSRGVSGTAGQMLYGYDLATGAKLWRRAIAVVPDAVTQDRLTYAGPRVMATRRGIMVLGQTSEPLRFHSLDLRSGRTRATSVHRRGCEVHGAATGRSAMLLSHCPGDGLRLTSVNPGTLRPDWTRPLPLSYSLTQTPEAEEHPWMEITAGAAGIVYVHAGNDGFFYAEDGRRLSSSREAVTGAAPAGGSPPMFVGSYPETAKDGELVLEERWPLPAYLIALDPAGGRLSGLPLDRPLHHLSLAGTARDLAFVHEQRYGSGRLTAYRLVHGLPRGPAPLGQVPPDAWPDACALLTGRDLRAVADGYRAVPGRRTPAGTPLPKPAGCDWIPSTDDGAVISVSVEWVAPSSARARELFAAEVAHLRKEARVDPTGVTPQLYPYTDSTPSGTFGGTLVHVGPVIVRLTSTSRGALRRLAPLLRDNLLARYQPGVRAPAPVRKGGWSHPTDGSIYPDPVVTGGVVHTGSSDGRVYALDAATGRARWSHQTGDTVLFSPVVAGGTVYAANTSGMAVALEAATGRPRWSRRLGVTRCLVTAKGRVYACTEDAEVIALDAASGQTLWTARLDGNVLNPDPVVSGGVVYVGSDHGVVYALDAATGARRWRFRTGGSQDTADLALAGGSVYVLNETGRAHALDRATGKARWTSRLGATLGAGPVVAGGTVYLGGADGTTYALEAASGRQRWSFSTVGDDRVMEWDVATAGDLVYVGGNDHRMYALHAASGAVRWSFRVSDAVVSGPAAAGDAVYVGDDSGTLYALDPATGLPRWSFGTGGSVETTPLVAGDLVYVGSSNGNLYALRTSDGATGG